MIKQLPKHPNYAIDEFGCVRRIHEDGLMPLVPDTSNGYKRVDIDGKKEYIARLVLETFMPEATRNLRVFYIDGNPMNCTLSNLVWLSPSDIAIYSTYTVEYRKKLLTRARD